MKDQKVKLKNYWLNTPTNHLHLRLKIVPKASFTVVEKSSLQKKQENWFVRLGTKNYRVGEQRLSAELWKKLVQKTRTFFEQNPVKRLLKAKHITRKASPECHLKWHHLFWTSTKEIMISQSKVSKDILKYNLLKKKQID